MNIEKRSHKRESCKLDRIRVVRIRMVPFSSNSGITLKTSKERNQPSFEEEERQGFLILEANVRTNEKDKANIFLSPIP